MCTYDWVVCTLECILLKYIQIEKHKAWTSIQNPERASGPHYGHLMFVCNWYVNHRLSPSSWTFHPPTNSAGAVWQGQVTKSVLRHNALLEIPKFAYGIERPGRKWHMGAVMWFLLPRFHRSVSEKNKECGKESISGPDDFLVILTPQEDIWWALGSISGSQGRFGGVVPRSRGNILGGRYFSEWLTHGCALWWDSDGMTRVKAQSGFHFHRLFKSIFIYISQSWSFDLDLDTFLHVKGVTFLRYNKPLCAGRKQLSKLIKMP